MRKHGFLASLLSAVLVVCSMLPCFTLHVAAADNAPTLSLNKTTYIQGETITFNTKNVPHSNCHVSIMNKGYKNYTYDPEGAKGGDRRATVYCTVDVLTYDSAKLTPGDYVAVLFGDGWLVYQQVEFSVKEDPNAPAFSVNKTRYTKGESISFSFKNTTSDYLVAILKDGYTNYTASTSGGDRMGVVYGTNASASYSTSNLPAGRYALVLFRSGWNYISRTYIEVVDPANPKTFSLNKSSCPKGEEITFSFNNTVTGDYIMIFPKNASDYSVRYGYTVLKARQTSHTYSTAELPVGSYTARLFDNTGNWTLLHSVNFDVTEEIPVKSISLASDEVGAGATFTFTCKNTTANDYIAICPVSSGSDIASSVIVRQSCSNPTFTANDNLPAGRYVAYLCENGSYSSILSQVYFAVRSYVNDGKTITVYKQTKLTLSNEPHDEVENKLFIGWEKADGSRVSDTVTLTAGTKLIAKYVDFSLAEGGDFFILGTQMRTSGVQGLRFIVERSNALAKALPNAEFGSLVLPAVVLNQNKWADLTYGASFAYGGSSYTAAAVPAEKIFKATQTATQYTVCLTGMDIEKYNRQYLVRGYVQYTDLNGNDAIAYTEEYATRLYTVAVTTLEEVPTLDSSTKNTLNTVISEVKAYVAKEYNEVKLTVTGSAANPNTYVYQLKDSGIKVREVTIDSGKGGEAVQLAYVTDSHFSASKTSAVAPLRKILDFTSTADKILLGGDNIDNVSDTSFKILKRELWDMAPTAFAALGNHDIVDGTGKSLSKDQIYAELQANWNHNIYYASDVIKNKVMVIQLHNGDKAFHQEQIAPLTADLKKARQNGYAVVIVTHIPLCTNNPNEGKVTSLGGGGTTYDFYSNQINDFVGSARLPEGATKEVYNLIINNADIIDGIFTGHVHADYYTEIIGKSPTGAQAKIPQYTGASCSGGSVIKITVK